MRNPRRDEMIEEQIAAHPGEPVTVENLAKYLPEGFGLDAEDVEPYAPIEFEGEQPAADSAKPEARPAPIFTPQQIELATQCKLEADQRLANARANLMAVTRIEQEKRAALAVAVSAFQKGFKPYTPQDLRRDFVKEQQAIRDAIARGEMPGRPGPKIGKSAVDRQAFYSRGGNPAHGDYRRGAMPSQMRGARNYDPRRGPVAKLPSEV